MKKTIVAATIMAMTSGVALAADPEWKPSVDADNQGGGEVRFLGEVKSASCTITVAGQGNNATVRLPYINANEFEKNNHPYKATKFDIELNDCDLSKDKDTVMVSWAEAQLDEATLGYLTNTATADAAEGVSLVIHDVDGKKDIIPGTHAGAIGGDASGYTREKNSAVGKYTHGEEGKGSAVIPFTVAYITNDFHKVKAGKVAATAVYSVYYE